MSRLFGGDDPSVRFVAGSLIAGVFFGGVGAGVAFPTLPTLGPLLGISPFLVGLILSANRFTRLVMNTPAGQILDTMGTRRPMIAGFVVQGLSPFGYVLGLNASLVPLDAASIFLLSRALWGVGSAFVFVGAFSTITHVTTPGNRGKWVGYMRGGQSLGFPAGLVVGGLVTDAFGYSTAFFVAGCAASFAAVVAAVVLPNVDTDVETASSLRDVPRLVRADVRIFTVGAVNFVVRFLFAGVLLSTAVLYARASNLSIGLLSETGVSGVVMAVAVVASSVTTLFVGRYSDRLANRASLALPGLAILGTGFATLALVPTLPAVLVGVALVGVGVGASNPPLLAYLGDISPADDVGKLGGVYNVFGDVGSTLGPLVAVPLVEYVGFRAEYLACVGLVAVVGVLVAKTLYGETDPVPRSRLS
ncbi:MFS transporter [Halogeometricum limi]|uniref:Predicted arabinose efflux permease, MFS family n=1 Tax=Halogeometricum limi TaxID=555875 RepID=A0A1I6FZB6_9EURY|nr:MFS transporter [Halogeometricum limi]SFR35187.1 Predicted arabinose efflux permease, MFS family [Halogeometricum limi]